MQLKVDDEIELRLIEKADSMAIYSIINSQRDYLEKWLPFVEKTKSIRDTEQFIELQLNAPKKRNEYTFTIRKNDVLVGLINLKSTDNISKKTEIGYWLSKDYQKQGIVTKSVKRLCEFAFNQLNMHQIIIKCAVENQPSKRIPLGLGFVFERIEKNGEKISDHLFRDLEVYSKVKTDL